MSTWNAAAKALLEVAKAVEVPTAIPSPSDPDPEIVTVGELVHRSFVAPGPDYAKTCSLVAVHLARLRALPLSSEFDLGPAIGCVVVPGLTLVLAYREECAPMPDSQGELPDPDDVEAWSVLYEHRSALIWQAVTDAILGGTLDDGCHDWSLGDLEFVGPTAGIAGWNLALTVRLQE